MNIRSIGIDLGKTTFHLVALGDRGKILLKKKLSRKQWIARTCDSFPLKLTISSTYKHCIESASGWFHGARP